jgi:cob(I)alamin adenosyltransferase
MKIYTKTGDKGTTSLIGGRRIPKPHLRIEAYGTVDELISFIGLVRDQEIHADHKAILLNIQDRLMVCASHLANDPQNKEARKLPELNDHDIEALEMGIDNMESTLKPLTSFVLPGGHSASSYCQVARAICRRAERTIVRLSMEEEVEEIIIRYLNRLADFLFVLSRRLLKDFNISDNLWRPLL